jgi:BCD family chlorophyll transporter-like MFS transporter
LGLAAFGLILWSSMVLSVPVLMAGTLVAGFGAGLFGHGTLTATMRSAPRDQIGLSLGAWGAVQATSAGLAIAVGGVVRDTIMATEAVGTSAAAPYTSVFLIEAGLLALALLLVLPLRGKPESRPPESRTIDVDPAKTTYLSGGTEPQGAQHGAAQTFAAGRTR